MQAKYEKIEDYFREKNVEIRRLNLGCGARLLEGYCNVDAYVGSDDKHRGGYFIPDCVERAEELRCPDDFFDEILAQHVFEHFTYKQCERVLREMFRVLKPGGVLVVETPDARRLTLVEAFVPELFRKEVKSASEIVPFRVDVIKSQRYGAFWEDVSDLYPIHLFVWRKSDFVTFAMGFGFSLLMDTSATMSHVPFRDFCVCLKKPGDVTPVGTEIIARYGGWYKKLKRQISGLLTILNIK